MPENQESKRTAILVRCTEEEASLIRKAAKAERRTISGYILNGILQRIAAHDKIQQQVQEKLGKGRSQAAVKKAKAQSSGG